jgi:hypothetical protein
VASVAGVVILTPAEIVRVRVALAVFEAESVTFTVKLGELVAAGVPVKTPPLDKLRLAAARLAAPPVTVHV